MSEKLHLEPTHGFITSNILKIKMFINYTFFYVFNLEEKSDWKKLANKGMLQGSTRHKHDQGGV